MRVVALVATDVANPLSHSYSCWLWVMERLDEAIAEPRAGLVHDPLNAL